MDNTPPMPPQPVVILNPQKTSGFCVTSMILGIISILGGAITIILPILAIIFGHLGYKQCKRDPNTTGSGMGITGLILGYLTLLGILRIMGLVLLYFFAKQS